MPLSTGQVLNNRYRIVKLLGQGGFGAVYRAWDINLEEPIAIKESFETSPVAQKQFQLEAKLLFRLVHPNLPRVHDYFVLPEQGMYLVMDYIEGENLETLLDQAGQPLLEVQVLPWIEQVCDALTYLHSQQPPVVHRDIKPANIRITPQGRAILVDFGIAKTYDPQVRTTLGARAVTPGYSPTEQYLSTGRTDARTDIYALGATLYTLLTGQAPPEAPERNMNIPLPAPRSLNPAISTRVETAVLKALEMLPEKRFQNAVEFKDALFEELFQPVMRAAAAPAVAPAHTPQPASSAAQVSQPAASSLVPSPASPVAAPALAKPGGRFSWAWLAALGLAVLVIVGGASLLVSMLSGKPETRGEQSIKQNENMKLVPAGEFFMGSEDGDSDERPRHIVFLEEFYIDMYETTNADYTACVKAGGCTPPGESFSSTRSSYYGDPQYDDYPVIYVDWEQASAYCAWRGARLPGEAEWERAARGGVEGKTYPWGDESPNCSRANYLGKDGGCIGDTGKVGSYLSNGYGLYDMVGNVWEWVQDWYRADYYSSQQIFKNPLGPETGTQRVLRGGSWLAEVGDIRVASRSRYSPASRLNVVGIRCSKTP